MTLHVKDINPKLFFILFLLGLSGAYLLMRATPFGMGLRDDSFRYLSAAESLANGNGYGRWDADGVFHPLTNFPPLYSGLLAAFERVGFEAYRGARATNILIFTSLIILVGLLFHLRANSSWGAICGSLLILISSSIINSFTWVLSDPLSLLLLVLSIIGISEVVSNPSSRSWYLFTIFISALSLLTRYANLAVIVTGGVAIGLIYNGQAFRERLKSSFTYLLFSFFPLGVFLLRNLLRAESVFNRPAPSLHFPEAGVLKQGSSIILNWIVPETVLKLMSVRAIESLAILILFGLTISGLFLFIKRNPVDRQSPLDGIQITKAVAWIYFVAYLGLIAVTVMWFDRLLPLNDRILAPLYLAGMIVLVSFLVSNARSRGRAFSILLIGISIVFFFAKGRDAYRLYSDLRMDGLGYASVTWRTSRTIDYVKDLPDVPIYSNDLPAIYLLAGRTVHSVPISTNPSSQSSNPDFMDELYTMRNDLENKNGYLVLIGTDPLLKVSRASLPLFIEGMQLVAEFPDGAVFHASED